MQLPGDKRSEQPDECGNRAGVFAEAIRDGNMDLAWQMLSKETRGVRMGVWATRNNIDMQEAYRAAYSTEHPQRASMLEDFRTTVLRLWPLEDLTGLGVAPTSYLDDQHGFAFLPFGVTEDGGPKSLNLDTSPCLTDNGVCVDVSPYLSTIERPLSRKA